MRLSRNSNLLFWYLLTERRNYMPILSIYFMSLPSTYAQQVGFYMGVGAVVSFFMEIPSGYLADRLGYKNVLIISKVCMLLSTISFIFAKSLWLFIVGSSLLSLGFAFMSGTKDAFMHSTLLALKRDKEYTKIMSHISGSVSLASVALIVTLPLLTNIAMVLPIIVYAFVDIFGLIISFLLVQPPQKVAAKIHYKKIFSSLKEMVRPGFFPVAIFMGIITGFLVAESPFRTLFLESIGFPIALLGLVMGTSRIIWFISSRFMHVLEEKVKFERLMIFELFFFAIMFIIVTLQKNPYVAGLLLAIMIGYFWSRHSLVNHYFIKNFIKKEEYKSTVLSIKGQMSLLFQTIVAFGIGFLMNKSYVFGHQVYAIILFLSLLIAYIWHKKK